ncbi:MAG: lactoylglutathione lyase family protein [Desulfovibrionaceae bacterium]
MYPRNFSHIGISVPDIDRAVTFYVNVMNWYIIMPQTTIEEDNSTAIGIMCTDVFGAGFGNFRIAHLSTGDGIGIELFEFPQNTREKHTFTPYTTGVFHFCVKDPNIEELTQKIVAAGGKQRMPIREYFPNEKPYKMVYCEDPFRNSIEIYTHSYELHYSEGAYQK